MGIYWYGSNIVSYVPGGIWIVGFHTEQCSALGKLIIQALKLPPFHCQLSFKLLSAPNDTKPAAGAIRHSTSEFVISQGCTKKTSYQANHNNERSYMNIPGIKWYKLWLIHTTFHPWAAWLCCVGFTTTTGGMPWATLPTVLRYHRGETGDSAHA